MSATKAARLKTSTPTVSLSCDSCAQSPNSSEMARMSLLWPPVIFAGKALLSPGPRAPNCCRTSWAKSPGLSTTMRCSSPLPSTCVNMPNSAATTRTTRLCASDRDMGNSKCSSGLTSWSCWRTCKANSWRWPTKRTPSSAWLQSPRPSATSCTRSRCLAPRLLPYSTCWPDLRPANCWRTFSRNSASSCAAAASVPLPCA
mmetsp:Transcript_61795/g.199254  ORF Transcript_61795/g.199254 Transcript_61795/m.199254 type:complete len:201 (-) Transcript_61795:878-1480(-)